MAVAVILHKLHGGTVNAQEPLWPVPLTSKTFRYLHLVWIVSFLFANLWNFVLNRHWTFRAGHPGTWWRQFLPFLAIGSVAVAVGLVLISLFTHVDSPLYLPEPWFTESVGLRSRTYWAQLLTIVLTTPINFVVNKLWTFRVASGVADDTDAGGQR
ncbi:MAG: sugar translocase [Actinomycetales bacterium]|nr:MAG: sugar translocase [Actinomycetales bacterium]